MRLLSESNFIYYVGGTRGPEMVKVCVASAMIRFSALAGETRFSGRFDYVKTSLESLIADQENRPGGRPPWEQAGNVLIDTFTP